MKKVILSKKVGWIIIVILLALDFLIDYKGGGIGHPIWQPVMDFFGTNTIYYLTPLILLAFYLIIKIGAFLEEKISKTPQAEQLVLTIFVIIYALYDIWLFSVNFLGFKIISTANHYYLIPIFIIIGAFYGWWAEKKLKNKN
jgi:arginine exporter protein ArgO